MGETNTIQATERSLDLIERIVEADGATLAELVEVSELSRYSVHAHLQTLLARGVVTKEGSTYQVGLATLDFGGAARSRYRSYLTGREEIRELAARVEAVVQVAFMEDERCLYVYQAGQTHSELEEPRLGSRIGYHSSAAGKAILSTKSEGRRRELVFERNLPAVTPQSTTDPETLWAELDEVADSKLATDFEEQLPGIWCVATPVEFGDGLTGAISISVPAADFDRSTLEVELADEVHKVGRLIEMDSAFVELQG
jgi:DNA-binding IclR family transcriptional regulator